VRIFFSVSYIRIALPVKRIDPVHFGRGLRHTQISMIVRFWPKQTS